MSEPYYQYKEEMLSLTQSLVYEKEEMLNQYLASALKHLDITIEEFARDYVLEEYPVVIESVLGEDYRIVIKQNFRIRLKTDEERQLEIEHKEKKDVDSDNV
jgi:hypothetical protein